ncbi:MAG TPA: hypothetical protein VKJ67_24045 [Methylomirabilota bacterium]|nr:hypothetical protein [Methylomirabilota bacterium]
MDAASELRQAHRTAAIITGGLITSLVMYAVIASMFRMSHPLSDADLPASQVTLVRYAAWIASGIVTASFPGFRRLLLTRRPDDTRQRAIARLTLATVVMGGIAEFPALAGLVLVILGGLFLDFYVLGSLSLALLLASAPRHEAWEACLATPAPRP